MSQIAMQVTICVPTYNSESTLRETLESLLNQTYRNLSIKIFDNASTDKTLEIARSYATQDARVQVFTNSTNVGAEGNFNRCLAAAEGDFTAIFHADDVYENSMVEQQVRFLIEHPECSAVATQASIIDGRGHNHGKRFVPSELRAGAEFSLSFDRLLQLTLEYGNFVTCPAVMARSSVYRDQIESWNGSAYGSSADLDVWLRLAQIGDFGFLTTPLMRYRVSEASFTVRETKRRLSEHDLLKVYRAYFHDETNPEKLRYLQFHAFKDVAARRLNILRSGRSDLNFPEFFGSGSSLFPLTFKSRYHFKFQVASYAIFFVTDLMKFLRLHR
ncbi:N/A [soil metagenome]